VADITRRSFQADARRPVGTLRYHEVQGFLFAVASAPEPVQPSERMPIVFSDRPTTRERVVEGGGITLWLRPEGPARAVVSLYRLRMRPCCLATLMAARRSATLSFVKIFLM
jgi:hypothetical protein